MAGNQVGRESLYVSERSFCSGVWQKVSQCLADLSCLLAVPWEAMHVNGMESRVVVTCYVACMHTEAGAAAAGEARECHAMEVMVEGREERRSVACMGDERGKR